MQVKNGLFGTKGPQDILSLCYLTVAGQSVVITGSEKVTLLPSSHHLHRLFIRFQGEIMKWHGNTIQASIAAHQGPVFSLYADGDVIVSGGKDGKVLFLSAKLEVTKTFDLREVSMRILFVLHDVF